MPILSPASFCIHTKRNSYSLCSQLEKNTASRFNLIYRYVDDVLFINNKWFEIYLGRIYSVKIEIKDTTESITSAPYLDWQLSIWRDGQLHTSVYNNRDDLNFNIKNGSTNLPSSPGFGVIISQLIRYARDLSSQECLFLWPTDFPVSYTNMDTLWKAWNCQSGRLMVDTVILCSNMKSPSHEC